VWGNAPFYVADNCALDVRDLAAATAWYKQKLGLREAKTDRVEDSGRAFVDLQISTSKYDAALTLVELEAGGVEEPQHVIFFAKKLEQAREWLSGRGVTVGPLTTDSGGNRLFNFWDLEGHAIEVCIEPG
jgi:catechol 2,3-dioxygenase-like lactoylglutathione lyase family enzyme